MRLAARGFALALGLAMAGGSQALTVAAAGDVMLGNALAGERASPDALAAAGPYFAGADFSVVNLEGPLGPDYGQAKRCSGPPCFAFGADPASAGILAASGVKAASLANNHAGDLGQPGAASSMRLVREAGLMAAGSLADGQWIRRGTFGGQKVTLISATANAGPMDWRALGAQMLIQIAQSKAAGDVVVVSAHGGCEGAGKEAYSGGPESCFGENRGDIGAFAKSAVDAGADLFLGHGPHVPRKLEIYKGRLIAYSLGNFAVARGISASGNAGLAPLLLAKLRPDGSLESCSVVSFRQAGGGKILKDPARGAGRLMESLSGGQVCPPGE